MGALNDSQLTLWGYQERVLAEQGEHLEASSAQRIAPCEHTNTNCPTDLLERIVDKGNMRHAYGKVKANKGAAGVDKMTVIEMREWFKHNVDELIQQIEEGRYAPSPVLRVEIPKKEKDKVRKLGIPTVVDRVVQQAIVAQLTPLFEPKFSESSFGFRPNKSAHGALYACKRHIDEGYAWVVDMDLEKFFDTVCQSKLIQVLSETVTDGRVVSLIHKYLNAGVMADGQLEETRVGMPQGGPLSPLLSNIMLNELDRELERRGHRFVRGWVNYFKLANMWQLLENVDKWMRRRIRMVYWKQWKRIRTRFKMLQKCGIEKGQAWEFANTRKGYWRVAGSAILSRAIRTEQLRRKGYLFFSDQYERVRVS